MLGSGNWVGREGDIDFPVYPVISFDILYLRTLPIPSRNTEVKKYKKLGGCNGPRGHLKFLRMQENRKMRPTVKTTKSQQKLTSSVIVSDK